VNNDVYRFWKKVVMTQIRQYLDIWLEGMRKTIEISEVSMAGILAKIQTEHLTATPTCPVINIKLNLNKLDVISCINNTEKYDTLQFEFHVRVITETSHAIFHPNLSNIQMNKYIINKILEFMLIKK
jgi:hypothetical protein